MGRFSRVCWSRLGALCFLRGRDLAGMSAPEVSSLVGYVFQNPEHQFVSDTVLGELAYSLSPKAGRKGARHLTAAQRELAETWLDRLGLLPLAEANPFTLSQGQKRRLSVAALLIRGQSALVLDEPTLGQDESQAGRLMAMMQEFRAAGGTVAMITHDMRPRRWTRCWCSRRPVGLRRQPGRLLCPAAPRRTPLSPVPAFGASRHGLGWTGRDLLRSPDRHGTFRAGRSSDGAAAGAARTLGLPPRKRVDGSVAHVAPRPPGGRHT